MIGATTTMSSRQWRGGGGSSSGARVSLISNPHTLQRYFTFNLRISPAGGGGGGEEPIVRMNPMPVFHRAQPTATPQATQMTVEKAGTGSG